MVLTHQDSMDFLRDALVKVDSSGRGLHVNERRSLSHTLQQNKWAKDDHPSSSGGILMNQAVF